MVEIFNGALIGIDTRQGLIPDRQCIRQKLYWSAMYHPLVLNTVLKNKYIHDQADGKLGIFCSVELSGWLWSAEHPAVWAVSWKTDLQLSVQHAPPVCDPGTPLL